MRVQDLLAVVVERGASDLHLSAGLPPMIRVDGDVRPLDMPALDSEQVCAAVDQIGQGRDRDGPLDADFCFDAPGLARFRVNVFRQHRGYGVVFRAVPERVPSMADLALGPVFRQIADAVRGLVLVTGPTGAGKSTTLAAMIDYINTNRAQHILTIEDPIEFVHQPRRCLVNQREVGRDTKDFAGALRAALREDPDVILVGEMRDLATIRLALTAAETGHLVFATLHTSSAPKTIDRVVDVFPGAEKDTIRSMLSESLEAVVSQVLVRRVGGGRVAAHEIMIGTPAVRHLIREHKVAQLYSMMQTSAAAGMQTLDQSLQKLVAEGAVSIDAARGLARFGTGFGQATSRQ